MPKLLQAWEKRAMSFCKWDS